MITDITVVVGKLEQKIWKRKSNKELLRKKVKEIIFDIYH